MAAELTTEFFRAARWRGETNLALVLDAIAKGEHPRPNLKVMQPARQPEDGRRAAEQILREIRHRPRPAVAPPRRARPGYIKEIVVKYKFRPIPYGARLVGKTIWTSRHVFEIFRGLRYELREHIMVVHLNGADRVISVDHAATGAV
jgi:hypothetical protein